MGLQYLETKLQKKNCFSALYDEIHSSLTRSSHLKSKCWSKSVVVLIQTFCFSVHCHMEIYKLLLILALQNKKKIESHLSIVIIAWLLAILDKICSEGKPWALQSHQQEIFVHGEDLPEDNSNTSLVNLIYCITSLTLPASTCREFPGTWCWSNSSPAYIQGSMPIKDEVGREALENTTT